jgi:hypothetical protein
MIDKHNRKLPNTVVSLFRRSFEIGQEDNPPVNAFCEV